MAAVRVLGLIGLLFAVLAPQGALADDADDIADRYATWVDAFNAGEIDVICDLYAEDLVSVDRGQPDRGYDEVCDLLKESLTDPSREYRYQIDIDDLIVTNGVSVVHAVWTLFITPYNVTVTEETLDVLRRGPDGMWRIFRTMSFETL